MLKVSMTMVLSKSASVYSIYADGYGSGLLGAALLLMQMRLMVLLSDRMLIALMQYGS